VPTEPTAWWNFPRTPSGIRMFIEAGVERGLTVEQCLLRTGLAEDDLDAPDRTVEAHQELTVARNLIAGLGDVPGLGTAAGLHYNLGRAGILGFAIISSPTVRAAATVGLRYAGLSSAFTHPTYEEDEDEGRIVFDDREVPADVRSIFVERDLSAVAQLVPLMLGGQLRMSHARLDLHLDEARVEEFTRLLPTNAVRAAGRTAIILARDSLDLPLPAADQHTAELCARQCAELLERRRTRRGTAGAVRSMLVRNPADMPSMDEVAEELRVDTRTLHRHLTGEGTSYRQLEAEVREGLAVELLSRTGLTVEEVARRLGYSEVASFSRAFKRWTGRPPSELRRADRAGQ
jgi:AraC-like DNA-binding protein